MQPEMYRASARIKFELAKLNAELSGHGQATYASDFISAEFEIIQSERILGEVIEALDLNREWGRRYEDGAKLNTLESLAILRSRLDLRRVSNTTLIEIRFESEDPTEVAKVVNTICDVCKEWVSESMRNREQITGVKLSASSYVELIDRATFPIRPVRPNGPIRAALVLASLLTGVVAIGLGVLCFRRPLLIKS
jgi:uncharacterized protein involved in exopolysaccharide biosynthesis